MSNLSNRTSEFFSNESESMNSLWQYVQSMSPETVAKLSQPTSPEVMQAMDRYVTGILGNLPTEQFDVVITTKRENLGRLLAAAMVSGYFLNSVEKRMALEKSLAATAEFSADN